MRYSQLSMGQCNRVNLLRYLLQDFSMLIMDESLANVDEPTRQAILYTIKTTFPEAGFSISPITSWRYAGSVIESWFFAAPINHPRSFRSAARTMLRTVPWTRPPWSGPCWR